MNSQEKTTLKISAMKQLALLLVIFLFGAMAQGQQEAQTNGNMNTLFGKNGKNSLGWMIGVESGYTQFDKRDVWLGGIGVGMVIDHSFTIGLAGQGWVNRQGMYYENIEDTVGAYLEGGYGGLMLEYTLFPGSAVHLTFPVLIGGGGANYISGVETYEWDDDEWDTDYEMLDFDTFFVIQPGIRAEISLLSFMRLNAGISYRYINELQMINTPGDMMNNFTATVGLKFGKF